MVERIKIAKKGRGPAKRVEIEIAEEDDLIDDHTIIAEQKFSKPTLNDWIRKGRFPKPIYLGPQIRRWRRSEIRKWVADRERESQSVLAE
jgi:predicted DNA-binding transcriptional regulator AlpA